MQSEPLRPPRVSKETYFEEARDFLIRQNYVLTIDVVAALIAETAFGVETITQVRMRDEKLKFSLN